MLRAALISAALALLGAAPAHAAGRLAFNEYDCSLYTLTSMPNPCPSVLYVSAEDGSGRQRITVGAAPGEPPRGGDFMAAWSPDGRSIAFSRMGLGGAELWIADSDGTQQRRVPLAGIEHATSAVWTPDGSRIVFNDQSGALRSVAPDGSDLRQLTPPGETQRAHSVMPDGDVTYTTENFGVAGSQAPHSLETTIWRADAATGERERIFFGDYMLGWGNVSPDGRWMALLTARAGDYRLQTLALDGSAGLVDRMGIFDREGVSFSGDLVWAGPERLLLRGFAGDDFGGRLPVWSLSLGDAEPRLLTDDLHGGSIAWWSGEPATVPRRDAAPPVVAVGKPRAAPLASAAAARRNTRIPLMAADATGIARVEASLARVVKRGCRFATPSGRLGPVRPCARARFRAIGGVAAWARMTDPVPRGTYRLRVRARDVAGHRTKRARLVRLRLRSAPR